MSGLEGARARIDRIDEQIVRLVVERTSLAAEVAAHKAALGLPVLDAAREREVVRAAREAAGPDLADTAEQVMALLMAASRARQHELLADGREGGGGRGGGTVAAGASGRGDGDGDDAGDETCARGRGEGACDDVT